MRWLTLAISLAGCNGRSIDMPPGGTQSWSGQALVVHEWGTHTLVVGSDGSLLRGLHHEEEDLPPFVYDRIKQGQLVGPVIDKMETPVLYFYSASPLAMKVSVDFPRGLMTQWFPLAQSYYPLVARVPPQGDVADPVLDPHFPFGSAECRTKYGTVGNGLLDWGSVQILARPEAPSLPEAPSDHYSWSFARNVAANHVRVGEQAEKFLFYRGLGNLEPPAKVRFENGQIVVENGPVGHLMALRGASFVEKDGLAAGERWSVAPPEQAGDLAAAMVKALDATGLYHDEAEAMVATWKRQWFGTPGLRLLYLAPASWADETLPLHLDPKPDSLVRVMVIRVELLTPDDEAADVTALAQLGDANTAANGEAHYRALGRFAEPHLRRAMQLSGNPAYGQAFLDEIAGADVSSAGE